MQTQMKPKQYDKTILYHLILLIGIFIGTNCQNSTHELQFQEEAFKKFNHLNERSHINIKTTIEQENITCRASTTNGELIGLVTGHHLKLYFMKAIDSYQLFHLYAQPNQSEIGSISFSQIYQQQERAKDKHSQTEKLKDQQEGLRNLANLIIGYINGKVTILKIYLQTKVVETILLHYSVMQMGQLRLVVGGAEYFPFYTVVGDTNISVYQLVQPQRISSSTLQLITHISIPPNPSSQNGHSRANLNPQKKHLSIIHNNNLIQLKYSLTQSLSQQKSNQILYTVTHLSQIQDIISSDIDVGDYEIVDFSVSRVNGRELLVLRANAGVDSNMDSFYHHYRHTHATMISDSKTTTHKSMIGNLVQQFLIGIASLTQKLANLMLKLTYTPAKQTIYLKQKQSIIKHYSQTFQSTNSQSMLVVIASQSVTGVTIDKTGRYVAYTNATHLMVGAILESPPELQKQIYKHVKVQQLGSKRIFTDNAISHQFYNYNQLIYIYQQRLTLTQPTPVSQPNSHPNKLYIVHTCHSQSCTNFCGPVCGDCFVDSNAETCDDCNAISGDGCSSSCVIQVMLEVQYIWKSDVENVVEIVMSGTTLEPYIFDFGSVDLAQLLNIQVIPQNTTTNATSLYYYQLIHQNSGQFIIKITYNSDLQDANVIITLVQSQQSQPIALQTYQFRLVPTDNEFTSHYTQSAYSLASATRVLAIVTCSFGLLFYLLGIFGAKVIGIEMMSVLQVSYLSLLCMGGLNPGFNALTSLWFINGYNMLYHPETSRQYLLSAGTRQMKGVQLFARFLENYNYTFLVLIVLPLLVALVVFVLTKTVYKGSASPVSEQDPNRDNTFNLTNRNAQMLQKQQADQHSQQQLRHTRLSRLWRRLLFEFVFNGIMFSSYLFGVCVVLQFAYGISTLSASSFLDVGSLVLVAVMMVLMIVYGVLLTLEKFNRQFGDFATAFTKDSRLNRRAYVLYLAEHILIGILIAVLSGVTVFVHIVPICVFSAYIAAVLVRRPYKTALNNARFVANMSIAIAVQIVFVVYNADIAAKGAAQSKQPAYEALPVIVCVLLLMCVLYNGVLITWEIVKVIKKCKQNLKNSDPKQNQQISAQKSDKNRNNMMKEQQSQQNSIGSTNKQLNRDIQDNQWKQFYEQAHKITQSLKPGVRHQNIRRQIKPQIKSNKNKSMNQQQNNQINQNGVQNQAQNEHITNNQTTRKKIKQELYKNQAINQKKNQDISQNQELVFQNFHLMETIIMGQQSQNLKDI